MNRDQEIQKAVDEVGGGVSANSAAAIFKKLGVDEIDTGALRAWGRSRRLPRVGHAIFFSAADLIEIAAAFSKR